MPIFRLFLIKCFTFTFLSTANASITDFGTWTAIADPAHPSLTASQTPSTASTTKGAASGPLIGTFAGIQEQWSGDKLMASFFVRSDTPPLFGTHWQAGDASASFTNVRVLHGAAITIPEPTTAFVSALVFGMIFCRRSRYQI